MLKTFIELCVKTTNGFQCRVDVEIQSDRRDCFTMNALNVVSCEACRQRNKRGSNSFGHLDAGSCCDSVLGPGVIPAPGVIQCWVLAVDRSRSSSN
jgi:hypothetical protein